MFYSPDDLVTLGIAEVRPNGAIRITDPEAYENLAYNRMMNLVGEVYMKVSGLPERLLICGKRGCTGTVRIALSAEEETEGFVGGLA